MIAILLALASWVPGFIFVSAVPEQTWGNLFVIMSIDIFFFWLISISRIDYVKRNFMCVILALSIFYMVPYILTTFIYMYGNIQFIDNCQLFLFENHNAFSVTLSLLLIIVSLTPRKLLYGIDRLFRPDIPGDILYNSDSESYQNSEKDS